MAYDELFQEAGIQHVLYHPKLEADDCIAIATKHLINTIPDVKITIITADHDYLQLINDQTDIFTLKFKPIRTEKNSSGNAECDLFCKIILGDKSDNIPRVFNKCGKKTALKLWNDKNSLREKIEKENVMEHFERNKKLIDFKEIPENLSNEFIKGIMIDI
jgi:5'-3' exonuclease